MTQRTFTVSTGVSHAAELHVDAERYHRREAARALADAIVPHMTLTKTSGLDCNLHIYTVTIEVPL